jgi:hypothetical protein
MKKFHFQKTLSMLILFWNDSQKWRNLSGKKHYAEGAELFAVVPGRDKGSRARGQRARARVHGRPPERLWGMGKDTVRI